MITKIIPVCVAFFSSASPLIAGGAINVFNMSPSVNVPHHVAIEAFRNSIEALNDMCEMSEYMSDGVAITAMCEKFGDIVSQEIPCFDALNDSIANTSWVSSELLGRVLREGYDICQLEGAKILSSGLHSVFMNYVFDEKVENNQCSWDENKQCYKITDPTDDYSSKVFMFDMAPPA